MLFLSSLPDARGCRRTGAYLNALLEQQQRQVASTNRYTPRYDITEEENTMELTLDLPGVRAEDVSLLLQEGGKALKMTGSRKYRQHGQVITSEFDQMFTIDPSILDVEQISANLSDGVLVVSAPKLSARVESQETVIQITAHHQGIVDSDIKLSGTKEGANENRAEEIEGETDGLEITEEEDIEYE